MAVIEFAKYVNALPSTFTPNTVYFVKNGTGFDIYVSTQDGASVVSLNPPSGGSSTPIIPYVKRSASLRIFRQVTNAALTALALTTSRIYLIPFIPAADISISSLAIGVTTAAASATAAIGIYSNKVVSGNDQPDVLLASTSAFSVATATTVTSTLSYTFTNNTIYWIALISNGAPTIRALAVGSVMPLLGINAGSTASNTYYFSAGSGIILPSTYNLSLTIATGVVPAIYYS